MLSSDIKLLVSERRGGLADPFTRHSSKLSFLLLSLWKQQFRGRLQSKKTNLVKFHQKEDGHSQATGSKSFSLSIDVLIYAGWGDLKELQLKDNLSNFSQILKSDGKFENYFVESIKVKAFSLLTSRKKKFQKYKIVLSWNLKNDDFYPPSLDFAENSKIHFRKNVINFMNNLTYNL